MIYLLKQDGQKDRLIDAPSKKKAIQSVQPKIDCKKASAAEVAQILSNGGKVEQIQEAK